MTAGPMNGFPRFVTGAAIVAAVLSGGANAGTTASAAPDDSGADGVMAIEVSVGGGLAPPAVRVSDSLPRVWIAGDGRYLRQTPPEAGPPALIALEERRIPGTAVAGLLEDARAVGLLEQNPDFGSPRFADATVTRVVIVTGGERRTVLVSALGYPNPGLDDEAVAARARLSDFLDMLNDPAAIPGAGGPSGYVPTAMAVFVLGAASPSPDTPPATWPLGDLGAAGVPTDWPDRSARCLLITGADVAPVISAAAGAGRFTPWRSADGLWDIALRPLLPDEHSCADVVG